MAENSKSFLDSLTDTGKPESFNQEKFVEVVDKKKRVRIIVYIVTAAVLLAAAFFAYTLLNNVKVPQLVGMTLTEATDWAQKNKMTLSVKSAYDFNTAEGTILTQEIANGTAIRKNSTISIGVSQGADPTEKIAFPDIMNMTTSEINAWISTNKLTGVKIATANSDVIQTDHVISYTLTDDTEANFMRKSRATINVSLGAKSLSNTVVMTDFSGKKAADVLQWGIDNGVAITLNEAFDNYIAAGTVVSQSVKANTEFVRTAAVTVVISIGKTITVPDLSVMTQDEANAWAKSAGISLTIQEKYSSSSDKGKLSGQSAAAGSILKTGDELKVNISIGRVNVASYVGKTKMDILTWQTDANAKGANITLSFSTAYGEKGSSGKIISQSISNDYVSPGASINVVTSLGMKVLIPDFSGKTEAECKTLAQTAGITLLFNYEPSAAIANGLVISQNPGKNTVTSDANYVTVAISTSSVSANAITVPDFGTMSKDEANAWAKANGLTLVFKDQYANTVAAAGLFGQSAAAGSGVSQGSSISVYVSLGKVQVTSFVGKTKLDILNWLTSVNANGANITAVYNYAYGDAGTNGKIINQSVANDSINTGSTINFDLSLGKKITVPNFMSPLQNQAGCTAIANSLGMKLMFRYENSSAVPADSVISQSVAAGSIITDADTVIIVISLG